MYETGVYKYIYSKMSPDLMKCEYRKTYQSARLLDLSVAFILLATGHVIGLVLLIFEHIWNRKTKFLPFLRKKALNKMKKHNRLPFVN